MLFDARGRTSRGTFVLAGLALGALKVGLDYAVATFIFAQPWTPWNYLWAPSPFLLLTRANDFAFHLTMLTMAAPFAWIGVCLCTKRLRAAALPIGLVVFFFIPVLKWFFFAWLAVLPDRAPEQQSEEIVRLKPSQGGTGRSAFASASLAVVLTVGATTLLVLGLIQGTPAYGATLFIGIPFFAGLLTVALYEAHQPRTFAQCIWPALLSVLLTGVVLLAIATEGFVCLVMAAPLAIAEAVAGAFVGHLIMERRHNAKAAVFPVLSVLPFLLVAEKAPPPEQPPLRAVTSEIRVNAPIETVWQNVIGFSEIPPPHQLIFKAGIACPRTARIEGVGVGAVRHCIFTTGEFVEPITAWEEPTRLAFDVAAQPDPLRELSPYGRLTTPHLRGYFRTEHGEFELVSQGDATTLRGTTWYRLNYSPALYWRFWSDYLIHQIHQRVLEHIRACSEAGAR